MLVRIPGMGKRNAPPPPDILRKSGPQKDRTKYDRKKVKESDRRDRPTTEQPRRED